MRHLRLLDSCLVGVECCAALACPARPHHSRTAPRCPRCRGATLASDFGLICGWGWMLQLINFCYFLGLLLGCVVFQLASNRFGESPGGAGSTWGLGGALREPGGTQRAGLVESSPRRPLPWCRALCCVHCQHLSWGCSTWLARCLRVTRTLTCREHKQHALGTRPRPATDPSAGRRRLTYTAAAMSGVAGIMCCTAPSLWLYALFRGLTGGFAGLWEVGAWWWCGW